MNTLTVNFLLAPTNRYVGQVVYNNGYFFGSANTIDRLIHNVGQSLWKFYGKNLNVKLYLASKPTAKCDVPLHKMSVKFKSRSYFGHKLTSCATEEQKEVINRIMPTPVETPRQPCVTYKPKEEEFICKEKDGYMYIYKLAEVAKYKMLKGE